MTHHSTSADEVPASWKNDPPKQGQRVPKEVPVGSFNPWPAVAIDVLVVYTCYRSAGLTIDSIKSLEPDYNESGLTIRVAICENGSDDGSLEMLESAIGEHGWQSWVSVVEVYPNRGFAGGNNVILEEALRWRNAPSAILLLNTDTIVRSGAVGELFRAMELHPEAGVVSPRLEWPDGEPQISCFRYHNPISEFISGAATGPITKLFSRFNVPLPVSDEPSEPQWTSFAAAMIRSEVLSKVGPLDDGYYLYYDDVDYCHRVWDAGWHVLNRPSAHVVHLRGRSNPVKSLSRERKRRPEYFYASRSRFLAKYYGWFGLLASNGLWHIGRYISWIRETFGSKQPHVCEGQFRDIWINWRRPLAMPSFRQSNRC